MRYVETDFLIQILLHKYKVEVISKLLLTFICSQITRTFGRDIYTFLIHFHTCFTIMM